MKEEMIMKETFTINEVAMMTGLSTRTIRNYISAGFLSGDKSCGSWQFSTEQIDAFFQNKMIRPTLRAKKNAIVYDFIGNKPYGKAKMCVVLDLPSDDLHQASALFCRYITGYEPKSELNFASDSIGGGARIILSGADSDVLNLLNRYYAER